MKRLLAAAFAVLIAACTTTPPVAAHGPPGSPVARHGALSVQGNKIVGEHGQPVTLRGMSLFWSQWAPQYYDARTVDWLASDWKVDIVRAAIAAEGNDSARQHYDREMAKASTVIEAAAANGIYVIVDWHAHRLYPDEAERFLVAIATKYGHLPNLIYEPFNEPLREGVDWSRDIKPYHQRIIAAIRAVDPDNLIVVGSPSWSQDVDIAAADPLEGENIAYTLHYYAATHKKELRAKADKALAAGLALFVTEFGVVEATGNGPIDYASSEAWWDWAEANDVSWLAWSTGDRDETSATLKPGTPPSGWSDGDLTESGRLLRTRLRAAASGEASAFECRFAPVAGRFDPSRDLLISNFDIKTDVDDIHAAAALGTFLTHVGPCIDYRAVAGAYGTQEGAFVPAPEVFDLAFGGRWLDAHGDRKGTVERLAEAVVATLRRGGDVWFQEAGQSDLSASVLRAAIELAGEDGVPASRVHLVQHSDWNESVTSPAALSFVRQRADYIRIADGNAAGNGTPGFASADGALWPAVLADPRVGELWRAARRLADAHNGEGYDNPFVRQGGFDFSDTAELAYIMGFEDMPDHAAFFGRFLEGDGRP